MKSRIVLVVASCVLSVLLGLAVSKGGAGGERVRGKQGVAPRIGLSLDTLKEERWQRDRDTFVARARELGAEVVVLSANSDDAQQIRDCESLLGQGIDVLVVAPHNGEAMSKAVESAHAGGVPVLAYDRLIRGCDLDLYVTFDNVKVGRVQAEYLMERWFGGEGAAGGKRRIARIYGAPTDNNARLFKQGQDEVLKPHVDAGRLDVVFEDWAEDWRPANAKRIVQAAISKTGVANPPDGVLASNDGTAGGAIQALLEEGLAGKVAVTGQDADLDACKRIIAGNQVMTVYKPLKRLAGRAAELAVELARRRPVVARGGVDNGFKVVPTVEEDVVAVDAKNLRDTVIRDGFHSPESLPVGGQ